MHRGQNTNAARRRQPPYITLPVLIVMLGITACGGGGGSKPVPQPVAPTATLNASATSATAGQNITLTWSSTNATACIASGAWSGSLPASGSQTETPNTPGTQTYSISCTGAGGSAQQSVNVMVNAAALALTVPGTQTYRKVSALALLSLDPSFANATGLTVTQDATTGGPAMRYAVATGNILYYLSPAEQFTNSTSTLHIVDASGAKAWDLRFNWVSRLGLSLARITEADENGNVAPDDGVALTPAGIDASGTITASTSALSFTVKGAHPLDPSLTQISLNTAVGGQAQSQDVSAWFTYDAPSGALTITATGLSSLISAVQAAQKATLSFSLSSANYADTYGFEQVLTYGGGTINVAVVNTDSSPATDFSGVSFVARGLHTGATTLVKLDANGNAFIGSLAADTYEVHQVLLASGVPLVGFATVTTNTSTVALTITKVAGATASVAAAKAVTLGAAPHLRATERITAQAAVRKKSAPRVTATPADAYIVTVTAGATDTLITTPINYSVPQGTSKIGIHVDQSTEEFPFYTGQQSQYNDLWLFDVQLPAPLADFQQTGTVNQTNVESGTLSFDDCVDVSSLTKQGAITIGGQIGAQNVADDLLATTVTVTISLSCQRLTITSFTGSDLSTDGRYILYPRKTASNEAFPDGNVAGQYLSLPIQAKLPSSFGIASELDYEPSDATITEVDFFERTSSGDVPIGTDYLSQADTSTPGVLKFESLLLDSTAGLGPVQGSVQVVAVLQGTVSGTAMTSDPQPYKIGDYTSFTPIYLASELAGYNSGNRYGTHNEAGGDSWSTATMSQWVFASSLVYNDVSAALVEQLGPPSYRSVLGHSGHSDAQQVDVRYWDGQGGFTDPLSGAGGGQGIKALAAAALTEVTGNAKQQPHLASLVAWITQNRTNIAGYAARAEVRRIYIGNAFVAQLLVQGVFPGQPTTAVPGITAWTKPAKVLPQPCHLDHWHLSTINK